ncbi:MAG: tripartite tricarboxylate transporter substrate binding protein [Rhizobiales bacterium]|nr:tripartite tricarboxylate transporter substrate binding protein [Hyphomicrobiales bacterium]
MPSRTAAQETIPSNQTIRLIVTFAPGGGVDVVARLIADRLTTSLGQTVIVENRPGAAGIIAGRQVASAEPNGTTVLVASNPLLINQLLKPETNFKIADELAPVASVAPQAIVIVTSPQVPAHSLKDLLSLARQKPLNYATTGAGSLSHLTVEFLLTSQPGLRMQHVPFPGAAPALTAVVANQVEVGSATIPPAVPLVKSGKIQAVAVASEQRSAQLPDVPTFGEAGVPSLPVLAWVGFFVSAKTPKPIVDRLSKAIVEVARLPDVRKKFGEMGFEDKASDAGQFSRELAAELAIWSDVVKKANLVGAN